MVNPWVALLGLGCDHGVLAHLCTDGQPIVQKPWIWCVMLASLYAWSVMKTQRVPLFVVVCTSARDFRFPASLCSRVLAPAVDDWG